MGIDLFLLYGSETLLFPTYGVITSDSERIPYYMAFLLSGCKDVSNLLPVLPVLGLGTKNEDLLCVT